MICILSFFAVVGACAAVLVVVSDYLKRVRNENNKN